MQWASLKRKEIEKAYQDILHIIVDQDWDSEELERTPQRAAAGLLEMLRGYNKPDFKMTTFPTKYEGMVIKDSIPFASVCAHHIIPYVGIAHVGLIYKDRKLGISKIIRAVQHWSAVLSSQEELTQDIINNFVKLLDPKGVIVVMTANHFCEAIRGVKVPNVATTTSWFSGVFKEVATRHEFFEELKLRRVY